MGKKSKKLNKTLDTQVALDSLDKAEVGDSETNLCSTSSNSDKNSKKKNQKRDFNGTLTDNTPEQIQGEEVIENSISTDHSTFKIKKKKNKGLPEISEQEADQSNKINEIDPSASKKKKKKYLLGQEEQQKLDQDNVEIGNDEPKKSSKKKQNKLSTTLDLKGEILKKENGELPKKKKKARNKAKTGAPVLNDEEAQVTQEEIDKFCDELDEEDNKQYEDWVKLLDARLGKKQTKKE